MTSIKISGVEKRFGDLLALSDINLDIRKGEFFTLLGPSGCGKTTLLRTIAGFYRQDKGDIWLGDELINDVPAYKRNTGMVFQNYAVFPHMTVFENVAYGLKVRKIPAKEIEVKVTSALKNVHLEGYESRTPDKLSGGQQQRVGLARAMAIEPRVLLFDEPLSNLDAKLRVEMRDEIRSVQKALGITTVYVTHDQEEALVISDRIAVVNFGKIQQVGAPWDIYKDPVNLFVATFVGKINAMDVRLGETLPNGMRKATAGAVTFTVPAAGTEGCVEAVLAFRPEDVVETTSDEARANRLEGPLAASSFLGTVASMEIDLRGQNIVIERHRPKKADIPNVGEMVEFAVPPDACLLFEKKSGRRLGGGSKQ
ncbi:MAG TPA: ABC transporter ATP-binding protein [Rectinemataceae bacterium]|nr:ABC transporter ATP-binding protein [Rectinemataceae bacterium]